MYQYILGDPRHVLALLSPSVKYAYNRSLFFYQVNKFFNKYSRCVPIRVGGIAETQYASAI